MSGSVPAWKQAILDRKKQQQKEEELKQAEKEAYLSSLPPWKRALFLKKEKGAGDTMGASQQNIAKGAAKPTARQQQSTVTPSATTKNKPQTTAPAVASSVPAWKQKESPSSSINDSTTNQQANVSPPVNTNNNNSDKSSSWSKKFAPAVAETPSQKDTSTSLPAVVNGTDNIPLWKRNLLQKQANASNITGDKVPQPVNMKVTDTPQTSVAIGSPRVYSKFSNAGSDSTSRSNALNTQTTDTTTSQSRPRAKSVGTYDDYNDERLASLPPWKRDLILRKRAASVAAKEKEKQTTEVTEPTASVKITRRESMEKDSGWRKTVQNSSENCNLSSGKGPVRRLSDDKISMWKKKAAVDQSKLVKRSSQEVDPAKLETCDAPPVEQKTPAQQDVQPTATQHASNNVALVNGPEKEENDESAPPILRGKDPWAHLSESDPQFRALPLWKQALILRRRGDIWRRSNPDLHIDGGSSSTNTEAEDEPDFAEMPAWKKEGLLKRPAEKADENEVTPVFDDPDMPEWKKEKLRKSFQDKKKTRSTSLPVLISKKEISSYQSDASIPEWKKEAMREKESLKKTNSDIPEWKKEAMKEKQSVKNNDSDIPEWKKEAMKEKQSVKDNDNDIPEWKKEKKQTAEKSNANIPEWKKNEKKPVKDHSVPLLTSIRPLSPDKGSPSTSPVKQYSPQPIDETDYHNSNHVDDDDDDDVPCTNIDDLSDSDESAGGSGSYDVNQDSTSMQVESTSSSSGYSSDNSNTQGMRRQKSSKSILVIRKVSNPVSPSLYQCVGMLALFISFIYRFFLL